MVAKIGGKFVSKSCKTSLSNLDATKFVKVDEKGDNVPKCNANLDKTWLAGRRIIELGVFIEKLEACASCRQPLRLYKETIYALGSIFHIQCKDCGHDNSIPSGKRHSATSENNNNGSARCFDVNTKLAAAMINAGVGEKQMNNILAELNLPVVSKTTLKIREREIGPTIEKVANDSCWRAIEEEKKIVDELNSESSNNGVLTEVSSDGCWQKRKTGHSKKSLSGHVTIFGKCTKKMRSI